MDPHPSKSSSYGNTKIMVSNPRSSSSLKDRESHKRKPSHNKGDSDREIDDGKKLKIKRVRKLPSLNTGLDVSDFDFKEINTQVRINTNAPIQGLISSVLSNIFIPHKENFTLKENVLIDKEVEEISTLASVIASKCESDRL
ncbi:uncharacterized protein LOC113329581 [Papaver somniferum]|uniref:uncharacterized protein LOC113329581 n=1 Tax=Papaver somniferum TaxID=3469 RepID=UPI000E701FD1|nr:uncharacterized protein LOC113329581 [Papaver somniferum]